MTRLCYDIIKDIPASVLALDRDLVRSTGHTLLSLAARAAGQPYAVVAGEISNYTAGVVPITFGQGIIPGFAEAVASVLRHLGMKAFITDRSDISGIGEAFEKRADIVFVADDRTFLALNLKSPTVVDNASATAAGFVQVLAAVAEMRDREIRGREVLVLGLGPVGTHAVHELQRLRARVLVYDIDSAVMRTFVKLNAAVKTVPDIETGMRQVDYIFDATPAAGIINERLIRSSTVISCPGVPHGLTQAARAKIELRFIHDNLSLGVTVMAVRGLFQYIPARGSYQEPVSDDQQN